MGDRMASWKKKLTKENMAILALLGILLMVIALPVKKTENAGDETGLSDTGSDTMKTSETEKDDGDGSYTQEVENRLEALLSSMDEILNSRHSRIPVYEDEIDNIVGILFMKDFIIEANKKPVREIDIRAIMQKPYFIPENRKTDKLFQEMQKNKLKMAVLVDEYGGVSGIVTMEDLIEEIVGDLHDEYEDVEPEITELEPHVYQAAGSILLYDLNEVLHEEIESSCDTLSGYLIERLGYIPNEKQMPIELYEDGIHYTILKMNEKVIKTVKLELNREKETGG